MTSQVYPEYYRQTISLTQRGREKGRTKIESRHTEIIQLKTHCKVIYKLLPASTFF